MANITVSAAVHSLLNSGGDLTTSTNALGTLGAPVTATSITAKLGGTVPVANKIGNEFLKDTLEVDYISLTDQTGLTIPSATLGQKGGIAYFGNNPISDFRTLRFITGKTATGTTETRFLLGSIAIPASFNTLNNNTAVRFKLDISNSNLGANWGIQIVQSGSSNINTGTFIQVGAASAQIAILEFEGFMACGASNSFSFQGRVKETISNSDNPDPAVGNKVTILGFDYVLHSAEPSSFAYNTASNLQIYAVELSATAGNVAVINGQFSIGPAL